MEIIERDNQRMRKEAADWLTHVITEVEKLISIPGNGFNFEKYVSKWDYENHCGKVCCIEGWLPAIFPGKVIWIEKSAVRVPAGEKVWTDFDPRYLGIPVTDTLWDSLTSYNPGGHLKSTSTFEQVKEHWAFVIDLIKEGKMDKYITYEFL